jgi:ABC-type transport system substrate-binding protein
MMNADAAVLNPMKWQTVYDLNVIDHIYEGLIRPDLEYNVEPGNALADKWTISADSTTWTFNIVTNNTWHDGTPVTIDDVYFTHYLYNKTDSSNIRISWLYDYMTNMTVLNSSAIEFVFSYGQKADDVFYEIAVNGILPKHIWEAHEADPLAFNNPAPVGCGPWKFEEWVKGDFFRFSAHSGYWKNGGPYVSEKIIKIVYEMESAYYDLQTGALDVLTNPPKELENLAKLDPDIETQAFLDDYPLCIFMNQRRYPNNEIKFRQAVLHAINRTEAVEVAWEGRGEEAEASLSLAYGPFYEPNVRNYEFNVTKANEILDNLGWIGTWNATDGTGVRETTNGTKLSFAFNFLTTIEQTTNFAFMLQKYMSDIGVDLILNPQGSFDVMWHLSGGDGLGTFDYDWAFFAWPGFWSDHHPSWMGWLFDNWYYYWGWLNMPGWTGANQTALMALTGNIVLSTNYTAITEWLSEGQKLIAESLPYNPVLWVGSVVLYRVSEFEGWHTSDTTFGGPDNWLTWRDLHLKEVDTTTTEPPETIFTTVISGTTVYVTTVATEAGTSGFALLAAILGTTFVLIVRRKRKIR